MKEKVGCTAPAVVFGPGAVLFVAFLASAAVQLLLTNPEATAEGLLPGPLAIRAADSARGLDFPGNDVAAGVAAAVGSALDDTEGSTAKRGKKRSLSLVRRARVTCGGDRWMELAGLLLRTVSVLWNLGKMVLGSLSQLPTVRMSLTETCGWQ